MAEVRARCAKTAAVRSAPAEKFVTAPRRTPTADKAPPVFKQIRWRRLVPAVSPPHSSRRPADHTPDGSLPRPWRIASRQRSR
jgi:hypothetical protein